MQAPSRLLTNPADDAHIVRRRPACRDMAAEPGDDGTEGMVVAMRAGHHVGHELHLGRLH